MSGSDRSAQEHANPATPASEPPPRRRFHLRAPRASASSGLGAAAQRRGRSAPDSDKDAYGTSDAGAQERQILDALRELRDTTVREIMTPRVDVVALPIPVRAEDVARVVRESGHSAFPVYDDDLDRLIGILFVPDLFRAGWQVTTGGHTPSPLDISRRLRQPFVVPEHAHVLDVLAAMRTRRRSFAVVVDEFGGVAGILTAKDVAGRLVGGLHDEIEPEDEPEITRVDQSRWLVDGSCSVDEIRSRLGIPIPPGEYVTLGGYLFDALGRIPAEGTSHATDGWSLRVAEMDRRRVAKVVIQAPTASMDKDRAGSDPSPVGGKPEA